MDVCTCACLQRVGFVCMREHGAYGVGGWVGGWVDGSMCASLKGVFRGWVLCIYWVVDTVWACVYAYVRAHCVLPVWY